MDLVIFDCDGVLVDSEPIANRLLAESIQELGLHYSYDETVRTFVGHPTHVCIALIEELTGRPVPPGFLEGYDAQLVQRLATRVEAVPGVAQVLDELVIPYCVASNGAPSHVRSSLERVGFLPRFEGKIFSSTEVARPKPAPDLFLHAASTMGALPSRCAVIEDTVLGVQAGVAAGMKVFGYTGTLGPAPLEDAGALTFNDMRELMSLLALDVETT